MFLKDKDRIDECCKLGMVNISGQSATYLDKGNWAISLDKSIQMGIICPDHTKVKSLDPPLSLIALKPACEFSPDIKLPPYFKQDSTGFEVPIKTAKLHIPDFEPSKFRILDLFNLNIINHDEKTKKLEPTPYIPINQLRAQIDNFRQINTVDNKSWIFYVGS